MLGTAEAVQRRASGQREFKTLLDVELATAAWVTW